MAEGQTATKNPKQVEEQKHTTEERDMQVHKWTHRVLKRAECFHTQVSCTRRQYDIWDVLKVF